MSDWVMALREDTALARVGLLALCCVLGSGPEAFAAMSPSYGDALRAALGALVREQVTRQPDLSVADAYKRIFENARALMESILAYRVEPNEETTKPPRPRGKKRRTT